MTMHQHVLAPGEGSVHGPTPAQHPLQPQAGQGVEPVLDVRNEEVWAHHNHPVIMGRHSVRLSDDVTVTVAEDDPVKGAVESDIANIEQKREPKLRRYFDKWRGGIDTALPFPSCMDVAVGWLGAFLGILAVSITDHFLWPQHDFRFLVASFGASAVLVYGVPESKLAQPRNLVGGQVISAIVGVCVRLALDRVQWLANAVGMSLALVAMMLTSTTHPPGGATALAACSSAVMAPWHGFQFVLAVFVGVMELMVVSLVVSNFHRSKAYPTFWW